MLKVSGKEKNLRNNKRGEKSQVLYRGKKCKGVCCFLIRNNEWQKTMEQHLQKMALKKKKTLSIQNFLSSKIFFQKDNEIKTFPVTQKLGIHKFNFYEIIFKSLTYFFKKACYYQALQFLAYYQVNYDLNIYLTLYKHIFVYCLLPVHFFKHFYQFS